MKTAGASTLDHLSDGLLRLRESILGRLATRAARCHGSLDGTARVGPSGRLVNLGARADAIKVGARTVVDGELLTFAHGGQIEVGSFCFVGRGARVWSASSVSIGDRVLLSHGVEIHDTNAHPLEAGARAEQMRAILTQGHPKEIETIRSASIRIDDDVWIGFGATVFRGVTIGRGAIIGARAIVRSDVSAGAVVRAAVDARSSESGGEGARTAGERKTQ